MPRVASALLSSVVAVLTLGTALTGGVETASDRPSECVSAPASGVAGRRGVPVELVTGDRVTRAELDEASARELLGRLPVTIELRDSFGLALVGTLPAALDVRGAPVSCRFDVGDIDYSPADGGIAVVHSAEAARLRTPAMVPLGRVTGDLAALTDRGPVRVTIRRAGTA